MVDAPVSGAQWGAEAAELVFMVGGAAPTSSASGRCSSAMGKAVFHLGPLGAGHAMKCLNNLVTAVNFARRSSKASRSASATGSTRRRWSTCSTHRPGCRGSRRRTCKPARHQPQLRRSVQARADAEGHRHRDRAGAQRRTFRRRSRRWRRSSGAPPRSTPSRTRASASWRAGSSGWPTPRSRRRRVTPAAS